MSLSVSRRRLLQLGMGAGCVSLFGRNASATSAVRKAPRYCVIMYLSGGIDSVYTTDPKSRKEVEPWVDVPYASKDIVASGAMQFGPHFAPLAPLAAHLAIVNGLQVYTAGHGAHQIRRLRTGVEASMPDFLEIVGRHAASGPRGYLDLDEWHTGEAGENLRRGQTLAERYDKARREELDAIREVLRRQARRARLAGVGHPRQLEVASNAEFAALLLDRLAASPFAPAVWSTNAMAQGYAQVFQRALWALRNDVCGGLFLGFSSFGQPWDSHNANDVRQSLANGAWVPMFARFLTELRATNTTFGNLGDLTVGVAASDVGRFPKVNTSAGKDHFPEVSALLFGAGIRTGATYGQTGRRMEAEGISLKDGMRSPGGHHLALDDIGATLLHVLGITDPTVFGYTGRLLDFLVAA